MNHQLPEVQAGFRKGRGTRDKIANIHWVIEKAREFQKNIYFCSIDYAKTFDCVDHDKLENSERDGPGSSVHGFSRQEYWSGVPLPSPGASSE